MTTVTVPAIRDAMGNHKGDELTMANAWASVTIVKCGRREFMVSGADGDRSMHERLSDATCAALRILETYQKGAWR